MMIGLLAKLSMRHPTAKPLAKCLLGVKCETMAQGAVVAL